VRDRDEGRFAGAAALLRRFLANHPDHGDAARLLSETLYWMKDAAGARAVAEDALRRHPTDFTLRVQYGRMLVELGDADRARDVLAPAVDSPVGGRALGLLGTIAYWDGDLAAAERLF